VDRRRHAQILLLADEERDDGGRTDSAIASILGIGVSTAERVASAGSRPPEGRSHLDDAAAGGPPGRA